MIRACLAIALLCMGTPVIGQVSDTNFVEIPSAKRQGELPLPSVSDQIEDREQWMKQGELTHVRNVSRPTLLPVLPDQNASGAAMIIAPGGAFLGLAIDHEGWQVAKWLADHGVAAFVLKYRTRTTPRDHDVFASAVLNAMRGEATELEPPPSDTPDEALADGLAALRYVRQHPDKFGVDPHRVGFMGFSAGGDLTRSVVSKGGSDAPDFAAPIYPSMAPLDVPADTPPMFVLIAADDFLLGREPDL